MNLVSEPLARSKLSNRLYCNSNELDTNAVKGDAGELGRPCLAGCSDLLGGDPWAANRLLTPHQPESEGDTALSALQRGKVEKVLAAAENTAGAFS